MPAFHKVIPQGLAKENLPQFGNLLDPENT